MSIPANVDDQGLVVDMDEPSAYGTKRAITSTLTAQSNLAEIANVVKAELPTLHPPTYQKAADLEQRITAWYHQLP